MVKEQLPTEKTVLRERREALLHRNSNKYRIMAGVLDWMPQGLRLSYYGGRWVDDVVDGDELLPLGFETVDSWLDSLIGQIKVQGTSEQQIIKEPSAAFLIQQAVRHLLPLENREMGDDVKQEFVSFLEAMQWEYHRRINQAVLSEEEILHSYWEAFSHAQNITLMALRAKTRVPSKYPPIDQLLEMTPKELPLVLPIILGKAYSVNDLEVDLASGICNIPDLLLERSGLSFPNLIANPSQARKNPAINEWALNDLRISKQLATKLRQKRLDLPTKAMVEFLTAGIAGRQPTRLDLEGY